MKTLEAPEMAAGEFYQDFLHASPEGTKDAIRQMAGILAEYGYRGMITLFEENYHSRDRLFTHYFYLVKVGNNVQDREHQGRSDWEPQSKSIRNVASQVLGIKAPEMASWERIGLGHPAAVCDHWNYLRTAWPLPIAGVRPPGRFFVAVGNVSQAVQNIVAERVIRLTFRER